MRVGGRCDHELEYEEPVFAYETNAKTEEISGVRCRIVAHRRLGPGGPHRRRVPLQEEALVRCRESEIDTA